MNTVASMEFFVTKLYRVDLNRILANSIRGSEQNVLKAEVLRYSAKERERRKLIYWSRT